MVKKALEKLWKDTCTVFEYQEYTKANKSTGYREVIAFENLPCKLSFTTIQSNQQNDTTATLIQKAKLFISSDYIIKPGSKISVFRKGKHLGDYSQSGKPAIFSSHQEIVLNVFKGYA